MQIREIMTPDVECIGPDETVRDAARRMRDFDVGPLPVCDDNGRLAGMITDRDITVRAVAEGKDPAATRVREVMTRHVVYCHEDHDVHSAEWLMQSRQIRRLVVVDHDKRLVGIVSLGDLALELGDAQRAGEILQDVSAPAEP